MLTYIAMKFIKTEDTATIDQFRAALYQSLVAPIDGMWEVLYIAGSQPYLIQNKGENIGYCCVDEAHSVTQLFLLEDHRSLMDSVVHSLVESKLITSAKLSSNEPIAFNACLTHSKSLQQNTLCYQYANSARITLPSLPLQLATSGDASIIRTFLKDQIGFDDTFGYVDNLVNRKEIYMWKEGEQLMATGECRQSDSQLDFADVGVVVRNTEHGKGLGSRVLHQLAKNAQEANRQPICSTTQDNVASQKAIQKAGFYCSNIIFDIQFS